MAISQDVVRRLTVVATERGLTSLKQNLRETDRAYDQVSASAARAARATEAADQRMLALLRQRDRYMASLNAAGVGGVGRTAVADAGVFAASRILPFVAAVGTAIAAVAALNKLYEHGAELLERYANAQRMVDRSDLVENLKKLSEFQNETLTADQVKRATELGMRLQDAKFTIEQFLKVQFNVTEGALSLQNVWVNIVETIAKGTQLLSNPSWDRGLQNWIQRNLVQGSQAPDWILGDEKQPSREAALARLGAAMGVANIGKDGAPIGTSFAARFNAAIHDLANVGKIKETTAAVQQTVKTFDQYDNAVQRVKDQIEQLELQSQWYGKNSEEVLRLKTAHDLLRAAMRAGREDTPELRAEIDALAASFARAAEEARNAEEWRRDLVGLGTDLFRAFTTAGDAIEGATSALASFGMKLASRQIDRFLSGKGFGDGNLFSGQGALGMLGAGAMGYQSGSPLMGVLGGAMAGAAFGPMGALAGAAIGGIGGLFGQSAQRRQQQQAMMAEAFRIQQQSQLIGIDTNTRAGSIQALNIQHQIEVGQAAMQKNWFAVIAMQDAHRRQLAALNAEWDKRELEQAEAKRKAAAARARAYDDIVFGIFNDASTVQGQLAQLERDYAREVEAEKEAGGEELLKLEATYHARRYQIFRDANDKLVEEEKRAQEERKALTERAALDITDYLLDLRRGADSPLSTSARLAAAEQAYESTLALAQLGNTDALGRLTRDAEAFRQAAQAQFGSSMPYQDVFTRIQEELTALDAVQNSENPVVQALNVIADRQENVFFDSMAEATAEAASAAEKQTALQSQMQSSLERLVQLQALSAAQKQRELDIAKLTETWSKADAETRTAKSNFETAASNFNSWLASYQNAIALGRDPGPVKTSADFGVPALSEIYTSKKATSDALLVQLNALKAAPLADGGRVAFGPGGRVMGPGGPRDDMIAAWLSNTEGVLPAHAMRALDAMSPRIFDDFLMRGRVPVLTASNDNGVAGEVQTLRRTVASLLGRLIESEASLREAIEHGNALLAEQTARLEREQRNSRRRTAA